MGVIGIALILIIGWYLHQVGLMRDHEQDVLERRLAAVEKKLATHLGWHEHQEKYGP